MLLTILLPIFLAFPLATQAQRHDDDNLWNKYEPRPRILMYNGHMFFHAGRNKNITFIASDAGSIYFGNLDLQSLPAIGDVTSLRERISTMTTTIDGVRQTSSANRRANIVLMKVLSRLVLTQQELKSTVTALNTTRGLNRRFRKVFRDIRRDLQKLKDLLDDDDCSTVPCQNGATCIDLFGKHQCLCPPKFTGENCEQDINECSLYAGTDVGCQNGATCQNTHGGFICHCRSGYHGALCSTRQDSCSEAYSHTLCGIHGNCVPRFTQNPQDLGYACICDPGFKQSSDAGNPTCLDVDECESNPCYPGAACINLPGSFKCSNCPVGLTGNGQMCVDIDECATNGINICSKNPRVDCINSFGSYKCGPCPPGYTGNGRICIPEPPCASNPCFPSATCYNMFSSLNSEGAFRCECPANMAGTGIGNEGCHFANSSICQPDSCLNFGTCQALSTNDFKCHCRWGYAGKRCEIATPCLGNVCNSGRCIPNSDGTYKCQCRQGYYGDNCELEEDGCGGHITNSSGTIKYPDWQWRYFGTNKSCEWTIRSSEENKVLELKFTSFRLMSGYGGLGGCAVTNLTLHDGDSKSSPVVASVCGRRQEFIERNHPLRMSTNTAFLNFRSATAGVGGFVVEWTSVTKRCGSREYKDIGIISYINYPLQELCQWHLTTAPGKHFEILISDVTLLSSGDNCSANALMIYDGMTTWDPSLVTMCGTREQTITVRSALPYVTIHFMSNFINQTAEDAASGVPTHSLSGATRGFTIDYRAIQLDRACGGRILPDANGGFEDIISSPNYGHNYFHGLDCIWILDASSIAGEYSVIKLEFNEFDVVSRPLGRRAMLLPLRGFGPSCMDDYLKINDGDLETSRSLGRFCNEHRPPSVLLSTGPKIWIRFHSDELVNGKGFQITYSTACERHFRTVNGTFQTPNFPYATRKELICSYYIFASPRHAIRVKFTSFDLGISQSACYIRSDTDDETAKNYVEIKAGHTDNQLMNMKYFCARYPLMPPGGELIASGERPFQITYSTDGSAGNTGFQALFDVIDVGCGKSLTGMNGVLQSPSYPDAYLPHMNCRYDITVPPSHLVRLTFSAFDLEAETSTDRNCNYDYISIYETFDNDETFTGFHGRFCGAMVPPSIVSSTNQLVVLFKSDRSVNNAGFSATYTAIDPAIDCDRTYTATSGYIESLNYPQLITAVMECKYIIRLRPGYRIRLRFENITLPCHSSTLMIKNGPSDLSPGFAGLPNSEICTDHQVPELRSQGNQMYLKFKTSVAYGAAFRIYFEQLDQTCGGRLNGLSGMFSAPQYPLKDNRQMVCVWHIAVAEGNIVNLQISSIDNLNSADQDGTCQIYAPNVLDVFEGPFSGARLLRRFCKQEFGVPSIQSGTHEITVRYKQGASYFGPINGFLAHFSTACRNLLLRGVTGTLQSPGFDMAIMDARRCSWRITTTPGNRLLITFYHFRIQDNSYGQKCATNYLQISLDSLKNATVLRNGQRNESDTINTYCLDKAEPLRIETKKEYADFSFQSSLEPNNHFALTWTTIGCGGRITTSGSSINVLDYSGNPEEVSHLCEWVIKAPIGMKIEFNITTMRVSRFGSSSKCFLDATIVVGLTFYAGSSNSSGAPFEHICDDVKKVVKSHTNELFVHFGYNKATSSADERGVILEAMVNFVAAEKDDECGGGELVDVGVNQSCPDLMPRHEGALSFYDGNDTSSPLISRFCYDLKKGQSALINSSQHLMLVVFRGSNYEPVALSGEILEDKRMGFYATYALGCGGDLIAYAAPSTIITNDDTNYHTCEFTISAQQPGQRVYLRFDYINLEQNSFAYVFTGGTLNSSVPQCDIWAMAIYDGTDVNGAFLNRYCPNCERASVNDCPKREFHSVGSSLFIQIWQNNPMVEYYKRHFRATYYMASSACGGEQIGLRGNIHSPDQTALGDYECIWTIRSSPGNRIRLTWTEFVFSDAEFCAVDYIELREINSTGKYLGRFCGSTVPADIEAWDTLWMKFRIGAGDPDDDSIPVASAFAAHYVLEFGGDLIGSYGRISSPLFGYPIETIPYNSIQPYLPVEWHIFAPEHHLVRFSFEVFEVAVAYVQTAQFCYEGLFIYDGNCEKFGENTCPSEALLTANGLCGWNAPADFISRTSIITVHYKVFEWTARYSKFLMTWQAVLATEINGTATSEVNTAEEYNCGGSLTATLEPNILVSPGNMEGYDPNLKCRWTISRPTFHGIALRVLEMDLEEHVDCLYDYIQFARIYQDGRRQEMNKICNSKPSLGFVHEVQFEPSVDIIFITDRTRNGTGFRIEYKLTCTSFDFFMQKDGLVNQVLTSPAYPASYPANLMCSWTIVVESNRNLELTFEDFELQTTKECSKDYVQLMSRFGQKTISNRLCSVEEAKKQNFTSVGGRLHIDFKTDEQGSGRGFKLHIYEVMHDCSTDVLALTELEPRLTLTSPLFPKFYPDSLDCIWVVRAPAGHRISFTVDPDTFGMEQQDPNCTEDFMEIRDGGTLMSPLVGRYCEDEAPGTIMSTGSLLFIRFVSDSWLSNSGFNATVELAKCGGTIITGTSTSVKSPNYPEPYPVDSNCEWFVRGPQGHFLNLTLSHLSLTYSINCSNDYLSLIDSNSEGDPFIQQACNQQELTVKQWHTSQNALYVKFKSDNNHDHLSQLHCIDFKCGFEVDVNVTKMSCGGEITDMQGIITAPGYPNQLFRGVQCVWHLKAINSRFLLQFSFTGSDEMYDPKSEHFSTGSASRCYLNLQYWNGPPKFALSPLNMQATLHHFCENQTSFLSSSDEMTLQYDDSPYKWHRNQQRIAANPAPFSVEFRQVPADYDEHGCLYTITTDGTTISPSVTSNDSMAYCHIVVHRLHQGTTSLFFSNFSVGSNILPYKHCRYSNRVVVEGAEYDPSPFEKVLCAAVLKGIDYASIVVPNKHLDIHVFHTTLRWMAAFTNASTSFSLTVQFQDCGGLFAARSGVITSPHYGKANYPHNSRCIWVLLAPEGSFIKLNVTDVDIEHHVNCSYDRMSILEGAEIDSPIIQTFCERKVEPIRNPIITSRSRHVTIYFESDHNDDAEGFRIEYEFTTGECGFVDRGLTGGHITSPNYPYDYNNDAQCIWDIAAPLGFHIRIRFDTFDVAESIDCTKDFLQITEIHESRAEAPVGLYNFYVNYDQHQRALCGHRTPDVYNSESNRLRLNFTTDKTVNAKGFSLNWTAVCGGKYTLSHGVITSPHYPSYYQNRDGVCTYRIMPTYEGVPVIALKFLDFDLDDAMTSFNRQPCLSDYVEIRDIMNDNRLIETYCEPRDDIPAISVHGPVSIVFVSNLSHLHDLTHRKKNNRGFKLSYAISKCGGEISLKDADNSMSTSIATPAFPLPYQHNLDCVWNISAPEGRILSAKFGKLELEPKDNCVFDSVELFDGAEISNSSSLGRYCGLGEPPQQLIQSTDRFMIIKFLSDRSISHGGFVIVVTATLGPNAGCGGDLAATSEWKELRPPSLNGTYLSNLNCAWHLRSPTDKIIHMELVNYQLEEAETGGRQRCFDYININDGYLDKSPALLWNICGTMSSPLQLIDSSTPNGNATKHCDFILPPTFTSASNWLKIYLKTDVSIATAGYDLIYYTSSEEDSSPDEVQYPLITASEGALTSLGYPSGYKRGVKSVWTVAPPAGHATNIVFTRIDLGAGDCDDPTRDLLFIEDIPLDDSPKTSSQISCKQSLPFTMAVESGRKFSVIFVTNDRTDDDGVGFRLEWTIEEFDDVNARMPDNIPLIPANI
uniref:Cubilin n=1 Tax=Plectus sambesii TaxID=2011161 RepID=A0A914WPV4_9BILA